MNRGAKAKDRNLTRMISDTNEYVWFGALSPVLKKVELPASLLAKKIERSK